MSFAAYTKLTAYDRWMIHDELTELIDRTEPDGEGEPGSGSPRPKRMRK